jgi:DNA-binding FadR family transcriptional regulator
LASRRNTKPLNAIRRTVVWRRLRREPKRPPADHHSFADHDAIVNAIETRDVEGAIRAMRRHLNAVYRRLTAMHETAE